MEYFKEGNKELFQTVLKKFSLGEYKNIVFVVGAGISVNADLKDFRSLNGIFNSELNEIKKLNSIQQVFNIDYFHKRPDVFYKVIEPFYDVELKPTKTHNFINEIESKMKRCYTQNIDGLELVNAKETDKYFQLHGSLANGRCVSCRKFYSNGEIKRKLNFGIPKCSCGNFIKPSVVLYGQSVPTNFKESYDFNKCDLLLEHH